MLSQQLGGDIVGATHGGVGGGISLEDQTLGGMGGYGHYLEPTTLGAGSAGANGGAAVYIESKSITVHGEINVDGGFAPDYLGGSAGGSIWLRVALDNSSSCIDRCGSTSTSGTPAVYKNSRILGSGILSARGSDGKNGGGGGRISLMSGGGGCKDKEGEGRREP